VRSRLVLYFILLLVIPVSTFTYIHFSVERENIRKSVMTQLSSIADTRKRSIESWLSERTGDLTLLSDDILMRKSFETLLNKGYRDRGALESDRVYLELKTHLQDFSRHIGYSGAALIDDKGSVVVSTLDRLEGRSVKDEDYFKGALSVWPGDTYIKDVFLDKVTGEPTMGFSKTIVEMVGGKAVIRGVAVLFYNLTDKFYPLILDWPGKGRTGETLIVSRRGNDVVFLNPLKFVDKPPTTYSFPVSRGWPLPALLSAAGKEGELETVDYRGVKTFAAFRYIPATRWGVVAKIDTSEAMSTVQQFRMWTILFVVVSALLVIVLIELLSKKIVHPLEIMVDNTRRIAKGDFDVELPSGGRDEIGELARSFMGMAQELRITNEFLIRSKEELESKNKELETLASSLDDKVKARTQELEAMNLAQSEIMSELDTRTKALEKSREELKGFADKLEESRNRVSENLEIVERANVELRRMDSMKDQFLGIISHELRTPLSLIMGYASNLLTNQGIMLDPEVEEEVEGIYKGAERLKDIIAEMLDVSKIDAKGLELTFEEVDLGELMRHVLDELRPFVQERKQTLDVADFVDIPKLKLDRKRMEQVLINIIGNAIKFTPDGGKIQIQNHVHRAEHAVAGRVSEVLAEHVDIVVRDTGIGLEKSEVENIFDKFYEVGEIEKHTTSKYRFLGRGVGLGLPIARGIIEAHGGWLWAESDGYDPEKCPGSSFHIMLPLRLVSTGGQDIRERIHGIAASGAVQVTSHTAISGGTRVVKPVVLIIEDDLDLIKLTEFVLRDNYDVRKASDGYAGMRMAREFKPDLILLDIYMEGINGYEVCKLLKSDPATKDITVAFFTAGVQKWEVDKAMSAGADAYITKPFKPAELVAKVDELISGLPVRNNSVD
jgi:signal transduction histidine kinase/HAMP domain-containing protein/ActR/RegA family two-component response regulator